MSLYEVTAISGDYIAGKHVPNLPIIDGKRTIELEPEQAGFYVNSGAIKPIEGQDEDKAAKQKTTQLK